MAFWTSDEIATLKAAIAQGVLTVTYSGGAAGTRTVTYHSLAEMRALLAEMRADVEGETEDRPRVRYATTSKGFGSGSY